MRRSTFSAQSFFRCWPLSQQASEQAIKWPDQVVVSGGVRRTPPTEMELRGLADGFEKLQSAANAQRKPHTRDALTQLSWHWNKAVLDHAPSGDGTAHLAARHAVDIAASTWPYWLAWPETHAKLTLALGSATSAAVAVDQARTRFPPQRWQSWWRDKQPVPNDGDGNLAYSNDVSVLPQPRRIMPFASMIMLCTSITRPSSHVAFDQKAVGKWFVEVVVSVALDCAGDVPHSLQHNLGWSEQAADDALLTTAALLLHKYQRKKDFDATDTDLNEAMCESKGRVLYCSFLWQTRGISLQSCGCVCAISCLSTVHIRQVCRSERAH